MTAQNMFGANGLVSRNTPGTGTVFYAFDERGNVAQRTNSSGSATSTDLYDAYGKKRSGPADVFGFGGQAGYYTDAETGLILCTNRHYDPQQGRFLTRDPIGYAGGINLYSYTGNNPVNWLDPSGLYVGVDDLIFTAGGAALGLIGQGVSDLITHHTSGWESYAGAAIGGAAGGEALLYTGPVGAGAVGGAASSLSTQLFKNISGKQQGFDAQNFAVSTTLGAITGFIPGLKIRGITAGRGNYNAIFRQMATKFHNFSADSVTPKAAGKMFVGRAVDTALVPGTAAGVAGSDSREHIGSLINKCQLAP